MKVLVLGATGMLGGYSAIALKNAGHNVVACGRRESDNGFFEANRCQYIGGVILEEVSTYKKLPSDVDAVVHLAGAMPAHCGILSTQYVQSIVVGMVNLLEWLRETRARRIIFNTTPSDVCAYFGTTVPVPDDAVRAFPKDGGDHAVYAICKNAAVDMLEHYRIAYGFKPIVFRHLTVYGWHPNADYFNNGERRVLPWRLIIRQCLVGNPVEVWGDQNRLKELLYIDDFIKAIKMALDRTDVCGIFNLPGDKPYTLREQIDGLINAFSPDGHKSAMVFCPEKPSTPQNLLDGRKVEKELGWKAAITWYEACKLMRIERDASRFAVLWGANDPLDICG